MGSKQINYFGPSRYSHADTDMVSCAHLMYSGCNNPHDGRSVVSLVCSPFNNTFIRSSIQHNVGGYVIPEEVTMYSESAEGDQSVCSEVSSRTMETNKRSAPKKTKSDKKKRAIKCLPIVDEHLQIANGKTGKTE